MGGLGEVGWFGWVWLDWVGFGWVGCVRGVGLGGLSWVGLVGWVKFSFASAKY